MKVTWQPKKPHGYDEIWITEVFVNKWQAEVARQRDKYFWYVWSDCELHSRGSAADMFTACDLARHHMMNEMACEIVLNSPQLCRRVIEKTERKT